MSWWERKAPSLPTTIFHYGRGRRSHMKCYETYPLPSCARSLIEFPKHGANCHSPLLQTIRLDLERCRVWRSILARAEMLPPRLRHRTLGIKIPNSCCHGTMAIWYVHLLTNAITQTQDQADMRPNFFVSSIRKTHD